MPNGPKEKDMGRRNPVVDIEGFRRLHGTIPCVPQWFKHLSVQAGRWFDSDPHESRIMPMEGLRGLAVFLVFLVHYNALFSVLLAPGGTSAVISQFAADMGHSGVDLFFTVSGYLIYGAALRPNLAYVAFISRRIRRIYPTFLVVLGIYVIISYLVPSYSRLPSNPRETLVYIALNVLLLPGMFSPVAPIITVSWSLGYEFFYYLTLPVLVTVTGMRRWRPSVRAMLCAALLISILGLAAIGLVTKVRFAQFASGMLLYEFLHGMKMRPVASTARALAAGGVFTATVFMSGLLFSAVRPSWMAVDEPLAGALRSALLCIGTFVLCLYSFHSIGPLARVFSVAPLRYWGNMSYSYYLGHALVLHALFALLRRVWPIGAKNDVVFWLLSPIVLILSIAGSAILYLLVEKPYSLKRRKPAAVLQPVAVTAGASGSG
jgi:exopolysaccharide production protein ExoZ